MSYSINDLKDAYKRLRSYVFYDNTDLLLRRQIVEFETNKTKDLNTLFGSWSVAYMKSSSISIGFDLPVDEKLNILTEMLNNYHESRDSQKFFSFLFDQVDVSFYPKKIKPIESTNNFITNERVLKNYPIERLTAFIKAPIEFHILSVLWIIESGVTIDSQLSDSCLGNRLLLNKESKKVVKGSGLFKPYFNQYQRWRDESVNVAKNLLENKKNALFINLDIKDYFHSVRIRSNDFYSFDENQLRSIPHYCNLRQLLLKLHIDYTKLVSNKYQVPNFFYDGLNKNSNNEEFILPIGLLSSYVLANDYLSMLDNKILNDIKPAYYGRYVDDILIVICLQNINNNENNKDDFEIDNEEITRAEKYILQSLSPIIELEKLRNENILKFADYDSLYCQSEKSLVYFFKYTESTLVIDKLKRELNERTSEFRDMPIDSSEDDAFEKNAYHLLYDGSEGKIRTLKDYKENRFGLTIYLTNKIFTSLRQQNHLEDKEVNKVLKFFRGINCLEYFRLWEKIFTFFLVNNKPKEYVEFYLHCIEQIDNLNGRFKKVRLTKVEYINIQNTLIEYLDCAHELSISLNPSFILSTNEVSRNFEFKMNELRLSNRTIFFSNFESTQGKSFWVNRFRESNFMRHQYITQPLLNYTKESRQGRTNLISLSIDYSKFQLDEEMLINSPRPIKFGECCIAYSYMELSKLSSGELPSGLVLGIKKEILEKNSENTQNDSSIYLNEVFDIYKKANTNHLAQYITDDVEFKNSFYKSKIIDVSNNNTLNVHEIKANNKQGVIKEPKIAFANTEVKEENIISSLRGNPNLSSKRYLRYATILKRAREEDADILLFPESFIPINLLSSLSRYSEKNQTLIVTGLEHINCFQFAFNFIVTIIPFEINGIKDSIVLFRLKNHYSPSEELLITGNHLHIPKPNPNRYDVINWNNIYITPYYCFELANVTHRSLFKSKIDLLVSVEWNKDTPYFSNIVEASSRDLHVYVAQVNTSQFGDSRLTQPSQSAKKDILRLKGGINDTILIAQIDISKLREFQRKTFALSRDDDSFKPLPPDFPLGNVLKRINNQSIL